jgi:hypothetical protein
MKNYFDEDLGYGYDSNQGKYYRYCPNCNNQLFYGRKAHCLGQIQLNSFCQPCTATRDRYKRSLGFYKQIPVAWFNICRKNAISRGLAFDLLIEDIADLYEKQNRVCAYTKLPLTFGGYLNSNRKNISASIDRIDSSKGYTLGNIELVHKDVNFMKQSFQKQYFIDLCRLIAINQEETK